ncbi:ribosome small subunit-dependent GTPase A [soil metagenome]
MRGKPKKTPRQKDLTSDYMSGSLDEDRVESQERFTDRSKHAQREKMMKTAEMRAANEQSTLTDIDTLPVGQVTQIYSLYCNVLHEGHTHLCVIRKTMTKVQGDIVVGDLVRFRVDPEAHTKTDRSATSPDGVIEQIMPRKTVLTRANSFNQKTPHPIVANAQQVLIVASVSHPRPKWGLIDRMIIAARSGGLAPIICLNKVDLIEASSDDKEDSDEADDEHVSPQRALAHYATMDITTVQTSIENRTGIDSLREILRDHETVLAGHSGVGKSSLLTAVQPSLDIRVGEVSAYTEKGRHTTTSAQRHPLDVGGAVIDTPGVKLFGLWNVTTDNLLQYFSDVEAETAPAWRRASYERILKSLIR